MSLLLRILPVINPTMLAGLFANNAGQEEIVTQVAGVSDTTMLLTIILVAAVQYVNKKFGKNKK